MHMTSKKGNNFTVMVFSFLLYLYHLSIHWLIHIRLNINISNRVMEIHVSDLQTLQINLYYLSKILLIIIRPNNNNNNLIHSKHMQHQTRISLLNRLIQRTLKNMRNNVMPNSMRKIVIIYFNKIIVQSLIPQTHIIHVSQYDGV